jgi:hypothetical protein
MNDERCYDPEELDAQQEHDGRHRELRALQAEIDCLRTKLAVAQAPPPQPAALAWTDERPTELGWYWARRPGQEDRPPSIVWIGKTERIPMGCDYEWAGPIPEPEEPAS